MVSEQLGRPATDDDLYSHLMYPQVFAEFQQSLKDYDRLTVLPTPAYFYGLQGNEEINVEIAPGKTLFIKLINIGEADDEGRRTLFFELNGMPRETVVVDSALGKEAVAHLKGEPGNPKHISAPLPGMISEVAVKPGDEVKEGDKIVVIEAMKMLTTVSATEDGVVGEILLVKGKSADTGDLLATIR
jgi:pyruvate carboxylase